MDDVIEQIFNKVDELKKSVLELDVEVRALKEFCDTVINEKED